MYMYTEIYKNMYISKNILPNTALEYTTYTAIEYIY